MTTRSRHAAQLARLLAERAGVAVRATYDGPRTTRYGGWVMEWVDGPTVHRMRALAAELADRVPEVDVSGLQYFRANSDMGEAVSLLLWLDADPDRALTYTQTSHQHQALEIVEDPERAAEVWQRRGRALHALALVPGPTPLADELTERIRANGWDHTLRWVDAMADRYRRRHLKAVQ